MGREATARCEWAGESGQCKVLLEAHELIVQGELRRRVSIASLKDVCVDDEKLRFTVAGEQISFHLGAQLAKRWAKAIATPAPSLAKKLGITNTSHLLFLGENNCSELESAIAEAASASGANADLIIASVENTHDLHLALARLKRTSKLPPVWIVYPKGSAEALGESYVRETMRSLGFIDTKIASVSAKLTGLRFIRRAE